MKFSVEAWAPEYGSSMEAGELDDATDDVDPTVECALDQWAPLTPDPATVVPSDVVFLDGVRRIDARVWITVDGLATPGVCASVGAGVVRTSPQRAVTEETVVERWLVTSAADAGPVVTPHGTFELAPVVDDSAEALYLGIHERMIALETRLGDHTDAEVVVVDGPLRGRAARPSVVGYVKTHHVAYLGPDQQRIVGGLAAGQRSPLFLIGGRFTRWSWYVQLPGDKAHPLAGVVRCELHGLGTTDDAVARADAVTSLLGRFASAPHKDSRAPQNLYPIAGLERDLRHRLGDQQLLERALRRASAEVDGAGLGV